jgi:Putative prokaryotic signal transducing protein
MDPTALVEVYSAFNSAEADIIANMLEAEGIEAKASGEAQGSFTGTTPEVTVMVHAGDADRARELILEHQQKKAQTPDEA